jgi:uncharacterized protein (TIGR00369 family)
MSTGDATSSPAPAARNPMPIMEFLAIGIDAPAQEGTYTCTMVAAANTLNVNNVVHGAALAALIDHAGGYGSQRLLSRRGVTSDLHIRYLAAARAGTMLTATASVVRAGHTQIVMEVRVTDGDGRVVAAADMALAVVPPDNDAAT